MTDIVPHPRKDLGKGLVAAIPRGAVGMAELPFGIPVEVEAKVAVLLRG